LIWSIWACASARMVKLSSNCFAARHY